MGTKIDLGQWPVALEKTHRGLAGINMVDPHQDSPGWEKALGTEAEFYLGDWRVQPSLNKLTQGRKVITLEHRVMRVLVCLAKHAPEPLTRDQLLQMAWPDLYTSEHSLTTVISELRKVFEDDPRNPQVIETIRKIGYRLLLLPVKVLESQPQVQMPQELQPPKNRRWPYALLLLAAGLLIAFWPAPPKPVLGVQSQITTRPLTSYPGGEFDPNPNPTGTAMAFVWTGEEKNFDIYLKDLNGETPRRLTQKKDFDGSPVWSPDGTSVAYMGSNRQDCGIYITSLTGGDTRRVTQCTFHDESAMDWSPDGKTLVFTDRVSFDTPSFLNLVDLATGTVTRLTEPTPDMVGDRDPCFSPDGRSIAFVRGTLFSTVAPEISQVYGDIFTMDLATRALHQVTFENVEIPGLTWTQDGTALIFASNRDGGDYGLWMVKQLGGPPQHLLRGKELVRNPILLPHTNHLIYEDWERDTNIWRLSLQWDTDAPKPGTAEPFIQSTRWESHPEFSPDGTQIAFASQRTGSTEIWVCDADGQQAWRLTNFNGSYVNVPRWSPDGKTLAFEVRHQGQSHIYVQALQPNATPRKITEGTHYHLAPNWSQDGTTLYFGSNRNGTWQVWAQVLGGTSQTLITPDGGFYAQEWGDTVFFTQLNQAGIWKIPAGGGSAELVIELTFRQDWDNWTLREQGIYFLRRLNLRTAAVCFYPFPSGPEQELVQFETHRVLDKNGITVSPDGRWLLFTKLDRLTGDIMQAEGFDWQ